jgi:glycosyltransferase involved in cell wall biosynthesis
MTPASLTERARGSNGMHLAALDSVRARGTSNHMPVKRICVVGLDDYAMLTGDTAFGHTGGESVQHVLLARAWRDLGLDASILVHDHGQPRVTTVDGIRAIAAYPRNRGLFALRFLHPRLSGLVRAMRDVDADVYYHSPASPWAGVAAWFAKTHDKRFILRIASDSDCRRGQQPMPYSRDRWLFDYGVRNASLIAAQTEQQRALLASNYGVDSEILNIAVEAPRTPAAQGKDIDVLWVGNFRRVKRPDLALELARRLPQYRFAIVGGSVPGGDQYFARLAAEAKPLPNVVMTGGLPHQAVGAWFDRSRVYVNTSDYEGFPNTFLQAWVRALPVASFFDPDRLIQRRALGRCCTDIDAMCVAINELVCDASQRTAIGERAREFVNNQYAARDIALRYLELLDRPAAMPMQSSVANRSIGTARDL